MKKLIPAFILCILTWCASAQTLPVAMQAVQMLSSVQFGIKGGANLTNLSTNASSTLSSDNNAGYLAGFWAKINYHGIQLQPEVYITGKNVTLKDTSGVSNRVKFTSIDVPILVGKRIGLIGFGVHFNTGPVVSFIIDQNQSVSDALGKITKLEYKDQALAWQFGTGIDTPKTSIDLRYEAGISSLSKDGYPSTHIGMFNLTLAYKLF